MKKLLTINASENGIPMENVEKSDFGVAEIFKCTSCNYLAINAHVCECQQIYCLQCFNVCLICNRKEPPIEVGRIESTVLSRIKIICHYYKEGCNTITELSKYIEHLDTECKFNYKCNNCGYKSNYKKVSDHINSCELISPHTTTKQKDTKLKVEIIKNNFENTNNNCTIKLNQTRNTLKFDYFEDVRQFFINLKCKNCEVIVPLKEQNAHYLLCPKYMIKCRDCLTVIQKKNFPFHNKGNCFMKMILFYESHRKTAKSITKNSSLKKINKLKEGLLNSPKKNSIIKTEFIQKKRVNHKIIDSELSEYPSENEISTHSDYPNEGKIDVTTNENHNLQTLKVNAGIKLTY